MIPGRRNDGHLVLRNETPSWVPPRPVIVTDTVTCPECGGAGERPTGRTVAADMFGPAEPVMRRCEWCQGRGQVSLEHAGVCEGCGDGYWLEDGCPHDRHACHGCAPGLCDDCQVAADDDADLDRIRWGARH